MLPAMKGSIVIAVPSNSGTKMASGLVTDFRDNFANNFEYIAHI